MIYVLVGLLIFNALLSTYERREWKAERARLVAAAIARTPEAAVAQLTPSRPVRTPDGSAKPPTLPIGL